MKSFTVLHIILLLLCMLVYQCTSAQDYLVTTQGDTLYGELKFLFYNPEKKVMVKTENGKEVISILKTKEYHYKNDIYHPQSGPQGPTFMKLISSGFLSLYIYSSNNNNNYDGQFLSKADGQTLDVPNLGFKKQMSKFLEDCNDVSMRIENGELSKKDLESIISDYNNCVSNRTEKLTTTLAKSEPVKPIEVPSWDVLEQQVKDLPDFSGKPTALEMLADIKTRVSRKEKIPNYIIEGLKETLSSQQMVQETLQKAISELN